MTELYLLRFWRLSFVFTGCALVLIGNLLSRRKPGAKNIAAWALSVIFALNISFILFLWVNHAGFPLNLELMEGTTWQEFQRAASFQTIYSAPAPGYVPMAYNPLYFF
jgi:hypothetical protein